MFLKGLFLYYSGVFSYDYGDIECLLWVDWAFGCEVVNRDKKCDIENANIGVN